MIRLLPYQKPQLGPKQAPRFPGCLIGRRVLCNRDSEKELDGGLHGGFYNPSTRLIKGTIFKEIFGGKISRPRLISIRWNFVRGKGTRFEEIFWVTNPENRDIQCIPIYF